MVSTMAPPDIGDRLTEAAEDIAANGWHRGDFFDALQSQGWAMAPVHCAKCAVGALIQARYGHPDGYADHVDADDMPELAYLAGFLVDEYGATPREDAAWTVAEFNDAPGRTAAEVIEALHEAAGAFAAGLDYGPPAGAEVGG